MNWVYPTGLSVEKNRLAQPLLTMRGRVGHDVKTVLHRENARRKHSAVCQLQRSRDRKVLAKRCRGRQRTCGFVAARARTRGARATCGARERERHGAQANARLKVLRQVSHTNSRSDRFEHSIYVPELKPSLGN